MSSAHELAQTVRADMPDWPSTQGGRAALGELERLAADAERLQKDNAVLSEANRSLQRSAVMNRDGRKKAEADAERYRRALERIDDLDGYHDCFTIARAALEHASPLANGGTG